MERFQAPAIANELDGQPVEQCGVRRAVTFYAKVFQRPHKPGTKVIMPHAIDHHASGERMVWTREPPRQGKAATGLTGERRLHDKRRAAVCERGGHAGTNEAPGFVMFAAVENVSGRWPACVPKSTDGGGRLELLAAMDEVGLQLGESVPGGSNACGLAIVRDGFGALKFLDEQALGEGALVVGAAQGGRLRADSDNARATAPAARRWQRF